MSNTYYVLTEMLFLHFYVFFPPLSLTALTFILIA